MPCDIVFFGQVKIPILIFHRFRHKKCNVIFGFGQVKIPNVKGKSLKSGHKYHIAVNWMMYRDIRKRKTVRNYANDRLRLTAVRKCDFLPENVKVCFICIVMVFSCCIKRGVCMIRG